MSLESNELWQKVKENRQRLDTCEYHEFHDDITPTKSFNKRWRCVNCGGEADSVARGWYELGLAHGRERESDGQSI